MAEVGAVPVSRSMTAGLVKLSEIRPTCRSTRKCEPSEETCPAASWPRCCSACSPSVTVAAASSPAKYAEHAAFIMEMIVGPGKQGIVSHSGRSLVRKPTYRAARPPRHFFFFSKSLVHALVLTRAPRVAPAYSAGGADLSGGFVGISLGWPFGRRFHGGLVRRNLVPARLLGGRLGRGCSAGDSAGGVAAAECFRLGLGLAEATAASGSSSRDRPEGKLSSVAPIELSSGADFALVTHAGLLVPTSHR